MKDVRIDENGELRCWNCGSKGFTEKRTFRSKAMVGVGALLTKKKLTRAWVTAFALASLLLVAPSCETDETVTGGVDPADYTTAEKLAVIHGDIGTAPEFQRVIDCIMASGIEGAETEEQVGDTLYASWEQSGKQDTLLEWAQAFC